MIKIYGQKIHMSMLERAMVSLDSIFCTGFWLYELQSVNNISILHICYPDILEDLYSPRTAAIDFVSELVRKRGKGNLQKFIHFIVEIFKRSLILWSIRLLSFTSWTL